MRVLTFLTLTLFLVPVVVNAQTETTAEEETAPAEAEAAPEAAPAETEAVPEAAPAETEAAPKATKPVEAKPAAAAVKKEAPAVAPIVQEKAMVAPVVAKTEAAQGFEISFDGYLRVEATSIIPNRFVGISMPSSDANPPNVGRNDGFALGDARLNMRANYGDNLYVRLGFDGSLAHYDDDNASVGTLQTGLKDAYMRYTFGESTQFFAGRFKPPYDAEETTSVKDQQFVHRSIESRGVERQEGYWADMAGMGVGRQIGLMVADAALLETSLFDFGYAVALTNGNSGDASLNDNDLPAFYSRLSMAWGKASSAGDEEGPATQGQVAEGGTMGVSYSINQMTDGDAPDRHQRRVMGAGLDFNMRYFGLKMQGQVLWSQTTHLRNPSDFSEQALGGHAQLAYEIMDGLELGYRFSFYDPRMATTEGVDTVDVVAYDQVTHHTAGLRYNCSSLPVMMLAEFTHAEESTSRSVNNDRIEAAVQVTF